MQKQIQNSLNGGEKQTMKSKSKLGLNQKEVKAYLQKAIWEDFCSWMTGQTGPVLENGDVGFFDHDVKRYMDMVLKKKPTYFD